MWNFEHVNYSEKKNKRVPKIHKDGNVWKTYESIKWTYFSLEQQNKTKLNASHVLRNLIYLNLAIKFRRTVRIFNKGTRSTASQNVSEPYIIPHINRTSDDVEAQG